MPESRSTGRRGTGSGPEHGPLRIAVTPKAVEQIRAALATKPAGFAVRLFGGGGAHPAVGMSLDRPTARDEVVEAGGVKLLVDSGSRPFLDEAKVDYLVTPEGGGFSVTGPNTPGTPPPVPAAAAPRGKAEPGAPPPADFAAAATAALKQVYDPEIPMNIVDLGLIYEASLDTGGRAHVRMTMTTPGCPVIDMLLDQVRGAVASIPGVSEVDVEVVWDPPWNPERMSEFAKRQLGFA